MKKLIAIMIALSTLFACEEEGDSQLVMDEIDKNEFLVKRSGMFVDLHAGHALMGNVLLLENADSTRVIRFENFSVLPGPDVNVYLSKTNEFKDVIDLGDLKGTNGEINYELAQSIVAKEYPYVLVWCVKYAVLFGYAELK